jgi:chromate transporter
VVGFNVAGLTGAAAARAGSLLPSTTLALWASGVLERHREARAVRAFAAGMAPLTLGLLVAAGWVLLEPHRAQAAAPVLALAVIVTMLATRISPLWLIALGAGVGAAGWV